MGRRAWTSVRRTRRSSNHDLAALVLVLGILVVAAVGVYLLAVAAVAFVAWLVHVATRRGEDRSTEPSSPAPPPPPREQYRAVLAVEPTTFDDVSLTKAAARRVFEAWVGTLPRSPRRSIDLVRSVEVRARWIGRLTTELEQRRVVEYCEPAPGGQPVSSPPFDLRAIDPWAPPADLRRKSRFIRACDTCRASGRVACDACSGTARLACTSCSGTGKYYGTTSNGARRMLNCKICRGKGNVVCAACTRGKIECPMCRQATKLACWFEIASALRADARVEPEGDSTRAFAWGRNGVRSTTAAISQDARILAEVTQPRPLGPGDLPATVSADWRTGSWPRIQPRLEPGERVRSQTFTYLEVPQVSVGYALLGEQQTVGLEGLRMLAPATAGGQLFERRSKMLGRLQLALATLPLAAAAMYVARGDYFVAGRGTGWAAGVVGAAAAIAAIAYVVVWTATLGRRARTWAVAAVAPAVLAAVLAVVAEPSAARASALVEAGQLADAEAELRALGAPADDDAWSALHLRRSLAATTCADATAALQDLRAGLPARTQAQAHADDLAIAAAETVLRAGNAELALAALACGSEAARTGAPTTALRGRIAVAQIDRCLEQNNWRCALERTAAATDPSAQRARVLAAVRAEADAQATAARGEQSLERRVDRERAVIALWRDYLVDAPAAAVPAPLAALQAALARDEPALAKQQQIAHAREEAEARRQLAAAERERQQEARAAERERRRQAAEEARSEHESGGLLCNDGTLSPSCSCGGPHRGCCSHHGGIAGCQ